MITNKLPTTTVPIHKQLENTTNKCRTATKNYLKRCSKYVTLQNSINNDKKLGPEKSNCSHKPIKNYSSRSTDYKETLQTTIRNYYTQTLTVVNLIVVNLFCFLARHHGGGVF